MKRWLVTLVLATSACVADADVESEPMDPSCEAGRCDETTRVAAEGPWELCTEDFESEWNYDGMSCHFLDAGEPYQTTKFWAKCKKGERLRMSIQFDTLGPNQWSPEIEVRSLEEFRNPTTLTVKHDVIIQPVFAKYGSGSSRVESSAELSLGPDDWGYLRHPDTQYLGEQEYWGGLYGTASLDPIHAFHYLLMRQVVVPSLGSAYDYDYAWRFGRCRPMIYAGGLTILPKNL